MRLPQARLQNWYFEFDPRYFYVGVYLSGEAWTCFAMEHKTDKSREHEYAWHAELCVLPMLKLHLSVVFNWDTACNYGDPS